MCCLGAELRTVLLSLLVTTNCGPHIRGVCVCACACACMCVCVCVCMCVCMCVCVCVCVCVHVCVVVLSSHGAVIHIA